MAAFKCMGMDQSEENIVKDCMDAWIKEKRKQKVKDKALKYIEFLQEEHLVVLTKIRKEIEEVNLKTDEKIKKIQTECDKKKEEILLKSQSKINLIKIDLDYKNKYYESKFQSLSKST